MCNLRDVILGFLKSENFFKTSLAVTRDRQDCPGIFHGHLVKLYADYAPQKLLSFLKTSDQYPIQEALGKTITTL